jgi:heme oxygenase (mycobilin-producing)
VSARPVPSLHVVVSDLVVEPVGVDALERAFAERLGEVEDADGFVRLEVWRSAADEGRYRMVTWWESEAAFRRYMGSAAHRRSHARIPDDPARARGVAVERFTLVAR